LQTFVRAKLPMMGVVLPSLLFAFAHANNPDATSLGLVNTFLAGIWFGFAYLKTRDIWFPFGIHLLWNFLQGPFFGINVSGIREFSPAPVFNSVDNGPVWLTGGAYGIEGGLACTAAILLSIAAIYYMPKPEATNDLLALTSNEGPPAREIILSGS
jgi:hypothetical protein